MRRNDYRTRNVPIFWFESLLRGCFAAVVGLFILLQGGKATASISIERDHASYFLSDHSSHDGDCSKSGPMEREARDACESENDSKDETKDLSHEVAHGITHHFHSIKLLFFQLRLASESRASISLIILHHCWKSFPR